MAVNRLKSVNNFDSLLTYLRDELDWPVDDYGFDDLTFQYTATELGLDEQSAAKVTEIRRLRPLDDEQPWGIFFLELEPKLLPVVALRRLLSKMTLKKRDVSNRSDSPAWHADDILFISQTGESDERHLTFAHFASNPEKADLPVLKVLGWDASDTVLRVDHVAEVLKEKLVWPEDPSDSDQWRKQWRDAFALKHREQVTTAKEMASRLAELARGIRGAIQNVLAVESENGPMTQIMGDFKKSLVHDLDPEQFADTYAQTITYGLLSARITDPSKNTLDDLALHMQTNPFLKELMESFIHVGGRKKSEKGVGLDFDELGVSDVIDVLDTANMEAVVRDFGRNNQQEDPVIHFFEGFLQEYDSTIRKDRGVFYTPRPVVSFIVRSVDELLRTEFSLEDGLADTSTWGEMVTRIDDLEIPEGATPDQAFVQILDPATGTGTFLVEVIDLIHRTMIAKWQVEGHGKNKIEALWNAYVPEHLLPRLYGYELMMAPYAIAHMKIGLKLYETGYRFESDERARVYLTNALEPAQDFSGMLAFAIPALAHESEAVNAIKRDQRFTVVIGNPPYSKASQNLGEQFRTLIERFRFYSRERIREPGAILFERDINNDYVKFLGLGINAIERAESGVLGLITSSSYLDGKNFRGVRDALSNASNSLRLFNLHGDSRSGALARQGITDENVFDIETGVCILLADRHNGGARCENFEYSEIIGTYAHKVSVLADGNSSLVPTHHRLDLRRYKSFIPSESSVLDEYSAFATIDEGFGVAVDGIKTSRDGLVIGNTAAECAAKIKAFRDFRGSATDFKSVFGINVSKWDVEAAQDYLRKNYSEDRILKIAYRPFDFRYIYYDAQLVFSDRRAKMSHLIRGNNLALVCASRLSAKGFNHVLPANCLVEMKYASHDTNSRVFPAFLYEESGLYSGPQANMGAGSSKIVGDPSETLSWDEVVAGMLAVLNSITFRVRYFEEIKNDFPGVPLLDSPDLRRKLIALGQQLIDVQLLCSTSPESSFPLCGELGGVIVTPRYDGRNIWITDSAYFAGAEIDIFEFDLAGYQVCKNWFTAGNRSGIQRKGTPLTKELVDSFRKVLFGIQETLRIRGEIDEVIEAHGGWPDAFQTGDAGDEPVSDVVYAEADDGASQLDTVAEPKGG